MVSKSCKNLSDADIKLLNSTNNVTLPNTSMRRVLMEHSNEYVTKSSARYIVDNMSHSHSGSRPLEIAELLGQTVE